MPPLADTTQAFSYWGYPDDVDSHPWPYELRFYDPAPEGITVTLRFLGPQPGRISLSDYTVGLERIPGFTPRPRHLDRSPDHSSDLVVVGRIHHLNAGRRAGGVRGHPDPAQPLDVR